MNVIQQKLINVDNFEDGQYGEDDSMYTDEDNAYIEAAIDRASAEEDD